MKKRIEAGIIYKYLLYIVAGFAAARYLNCSNEYAARIIIAVLMIAADVHFRMFKLKRGANLLLLLFSFMLSVTVVLGYHIHYQGYHVSATGNYIIPYKPVDLVFLLLIWLVVFTLTRAIMIFANKIRTARQISIGAASHPLDFKRIILFALLLVIMWVPYLLAYWPAIISNDAGISIQQAIGLRPYNNHHPIAYTLFIKLCFQIGKLFTNTESNTAGCVVYSICQMLFMSGCLSYMFEWLYTRFKLNWIFLVILFAVYGLSPYYATYSIVMWKDPIFSGSLVIITLLLLDAVAADCVMDAKRLFIFAIFSLIMVFTRNNGIYILIFIGAAIFIWKLITRLQNAKRAARAILGTCIIVTVIYAIVTGPVYRQRGVIEEKIEGVGLLMNQMARVVVYQGNLSEEDLNYLNRLLPLEKYADAYEPTNIDHLKWYKGFNAEALEDDFLKHWFSVFIKNPKLCFDAWEFETYGFWMINRPEIIESEFNISKGWPANIYPEVNNVSKYDIECKNLFGNDAFREILVLNERSIPISWVAWFVALLLIKLILSGEREFIIGLIPSVGLLGTLMLASPVNYWPRYALIVQYLLPLYIALFIAKCAKTTKDNQIFQE